MIRLLVVLMGMLSSASILANPHYWVGEITAARTVYEPVAEYQYEIKPLGALIGDESTFVTEFTIPSVISHTAVLKGSWVLVRVNTDTRNVVIIDTQDPRNGFADSKVFYELFLTSLNNYTRNIDRPLLSFGDVRILFFMISMNGNDDANIIYREKNRNLLLTAIEYYSRLILNDFLPFIRGKDLWGFRVVVLDGAISIMPDAVRFPQGRPFNKVFDEEQPIPNLVLLNKREGVINYE